MTETATPQPEVRMRWVPRTIAALRRITSRPGRDLQRGSRTALIGAAAVTGALSGLAAILFWSLVSLCQRLIFGGGPDNLYEAAGRLAPTTLLLVLPAGGLVVGLLVHWLLAHRRPAGVADVIEATALRGGRLPVRNGLYGALVNAASIGTGASVGREGPMIHLGATIGAFVRSLFRLPDRLTRRLIACGVAAGIAASFNAPIAGAIFAVEVVVGKFSLHTFAPIAIGSISGTIVSRLYWGDSPAFAIPVHTVGPYREFLVFALVGVLCAAVAAALLRSVELVTRLHARARIPLIVQPALGGAAVALLALGLPQVLGVGYHATGEVLRDAFPLYLLALLLIGKLAATAFSLGSSFGGGVFSPAIMLGAITGSTVGAVAGYWLPALQTSQGGFAVAGMAATAGAVLGAPVSTILIVFEMTADYPLTLAVMLATIVSSVLVNDVWGRSYFSWQLRERGVDLAQSRVDLLMAQVRVADLMRQRANTVTGSTSVEQAWQFMHHQGVLEIFVVGEGKRYVGRIDAQRLAQALGDTAAETLSAGELSSDGPRLHPQTMLPEALAVIERGSADVLPVVSDDDAPVLLGSVARRDLLNAYRGILERVRVEQGPEGG